MLPSITSSSSDQKKLTMKPLELTEKCLMDDINSHVVKKVKKTDKVKARKIIPKFMNYLDSGDKEQVIKLIETSPRISYEVVQRLDSKYIVPLLDILLAYLEQNPRHGIAYSSWFNAIFFYHAEYLKKTCKLKDKLKYLHTILDSRVMSVTNANQLLGRITLIRKLAKSDNAFEEEMKEEVNATN